MKTRLKTLADLRREEEWDIGQARTCSVCPEVFLTKKDLHIHRASHRNKFAFANGHKREITCEKTVTT